MRSNIPVCIKHDYKKHIGRLLWDELIFNYENNPKAGDRNGVRTSSEAIQAERSKLGLTPLAEENKDALAKHLVGKLDMLVRQAEPVAFIDFDANKIYIEKDRYKDYEGKTTILGLKEADLETLGSLVLTAF